MEHTPPPPPPLQAQASQTTCQWCLKPMPSDVTNCPSCGKLRKEIYTEKVRSYVFSLAAALFFITFFIVKKKSQPQMNYYFVENNNSGSNTFAIIVLILGLICAVIGTWYYVRVSQKIKTWWWV